MDFYADLRRTKVSVGFKKYLLGLDVHSRKAVIERCVSEMEKSKHPMKHQCIGWLENLRNINDLLEAKDRKEQIRFDGCWDELHNELNTCFDFLNIMSFMTNSA